MSDINNYTPSLAHGLPNPFASAGPSEVTGTMEMTLAPSTSGLYGFRYYDAREHGLLRKFGPQRGKSQLQIIFRHKKTGGRGPDYFYYFTDHDLGESLFEELSESAHPFEDVFLPKIRDNPGIPYTKVAG